MAVTCSESGFNAISEAMKLPNSSVIHTIDGIWAMQEFPVEVTHARQRVLTLLELFILRALNQIPNCSVRDIITQFGLAPLLVESTIRTLKLCNTISSIDDEVGNEQQNEAIFELNSELKTVLDRLAMVGGSKDEYDENLRQRQVIQEKIKNLESNEVEIIEDRYSRMKYQLNHNGKEALLNNYLKEPTESKIYSFARCMTTGNLYMIGGKDINRKAMEPTWLEDNAEGWRNKRSEKYNDIEPNTREIEDCLTSLNPNEKIEITTIEILNSKFEQRKMHLPLNFTLTVDLETKSPNWIVHLQRDDVPRVGWIEKYLKNLNSQHPSLIKHLVKSMPPVKGMAETSLSNASPLVRMDRLFAKQLNQQSIIVVNKHEKLTNLVNLDMVNLDLIIGSNTLVCLDSKLKKNYIFANRDIQDLPNITIPENNIMRQGSIAMSSGLFECGFVEISFTSSEKIRLPVLCHSEKRGAQKLSKVDEYLRDLLTPEHLFLVTGAETDLNDWINDLIKNMVFASNNKIEQFSNICQQLEQIANQFDIAYMPKTIQALINTHLEPFFANFKDISGILKLIEKAQISPNQKAQCWNMIEGALHALAIQTSTNESNASGDLFNLWKNIRQRKKAIPWEEMAHLENTLLGNCSWTRFEVNRHTERIVKDLVVGNKRPVSDLARMMTDLRKINVIDKNLYSELKKTKAGRNIFTHEYDMDADLEHTLEAIQILRLLATLTDPINDGRWDIKEEFRDFSWTFGRQGLSNYLRQCLDLVSTFGNDKEFNQKTWVDNLIHRLPASYNEIPFDVVTILDEISKTEAGLNFDEIKSRILAESSTIWAKELKTPELYVIPTSVSKVIKQLNGYGFSDLSKKIAEQLLKDVPLSATLDSLSSEINSSSETVALIGEQNAIIRWKRTIEQSNFSVEIDKLTRFNEESISKMGKSNCQAMAKMALQPFFGEKYDLATIKNGVIKLEQFLNHNDDWLSTISSLENWMSERTIRLLKEFTVQQKLEELADLLSRFEQDTKLSTFKIRLSKHQKGVEKKLIRKEKESRKQNEKTEGSEKK